MRIYHQLTTEAWKVVKKDGLRRASQRSNKKDEEIIKTDTLLDKHMPSSLRDEHVSRCNNVYGYLGDRENLIDIKDGRLCSIKQKAANKGQVLVRLKVETSKCWVSDLDLYDAAKNAVTRGAATESAVANYWTSLQQLNSYDYLISRPEIMITSDIDPKDIELIE